MLSPITTYSAANLFSHHYGGANFSGITISRERLLQVLPLAEDLVGAPLDQASEPLRHLRRRFGETPTQYRGGNGR
ncbi:MAG TPA: hypothetical protein VFB45_09455 [Pseudolabrys sp.]|nr:hypothetical protein [Pseudolabrys sp.]